MKYWQKIQIEDIDLFNGVSVAELARNSDFQQPHLSDIKNNKLIISEKQYNKLILAVNQLKQKKNKTIDNIQ